MADGGESVYSRSEAEDAPPGLKTPVERRSPVRLCTDEGPEAGESLS